MNIITVTRLEAKIAMKYMIPIKFLISVKSSYALNVGPRCKTVQALALTVTHDDRNERLRISHDGSPV